MKLKLLFAVFAAAALLVPARLTAQTTNRAAGSTDPELRALIQSVQTKLNAGKNTSADLAPDLADFDKLFAKHAGEKTDATAQILFAKAAICIQVLDDETQSKALIMKLKTNYPDTSYGKQADAMLADLARHDEMKKLVAEAKQRQAKALRVGQPFSDFSEKDMNGNPISVAALKGKVVLIDFWATWCVPCQIELPNVIATYKKFHAQGFEIIGVSLDYERAKLVDFLKKKPDMAWPEFFDPEIEKLALTSDEPSLPFKNKLVQQYGVELIPFTILVGRDGKIIGTDLYGEALGKAVGKALAKK